MGEVMGEVEPPLQRHVAELEGEVDKGALHLARVEAEHVRVRVAREQRAHLARRLLLERAQHALRSHAPPPQPPREHDRAVRAGAEHLLLVHHQLAAHARRAGGRGPPPPPRPAAERGAPEQRSEQQQRQQPSRAARHHAASKAHARARGHRAAAVADLRRVPIVRVSVRRLRSPARLRPPRHLLCRRRHCGLLLAGRRQEQHRASAVHRTRLAALRDGIAGHFGHRQQRRASVLGRRAQGISQGCGRLETLRLATPGIWVAEQQQSADGGEFEGKGHHNARAAAPGGRSRAELRRLCLLEAAAPRRRPPRQVGGGWAELGRAGGLRAVGPGGWPSVGHAAAPGAAGGLARLGAAASEHLSTRPSTTRPIWAGVYHGPCAGGRLCRMCAVGRGL